MPDISTPDVQWRPGGPRRSGRTTRMVQAIFVDLRHRGGRLLMVVPNRTIQGFVFELLRGQGALLGTIDQIDFITTDTPERSLQQTRGRRYRAVYFEHTVWDTNPNPADRLSRDLRLYLGSTIPFYGDIRPMLPEPEAPPPPESPRLSVWERLMEEDD